MRPKQLHVAELESLSSHMIYQVTCGNGPSGLIATRTLGRNTVSNLAHKMGLNIGGYDRLMNSHFYYVHNSFIHCGVLIVPPRMPTLVSFHGGFGDKLFVGINVLWVHNSGTPEELKKYE